MKNLSWAQLCLLWVEFGLTVTGTGHISQKSGLKMEVWSHVAPPVKEHAWVSQERFFLVEMFKTFHCEFCDSGLLLICQFTRFALLCNKSYVYRRWASCFICWGCLSCEVLFFHVQKCTKHLGLSCLSQYVLLRKILHLGSVQRFSIHVHTCVHNACWTLCLFVGEY